MQSTRPHRAWVALVAIAAAMATVAPAWSGDWTYWRGARQNGTSTETGLVSTWSPEGENLIWKAEFIGRSTPVVVDGMV